MNVSIKNKRILAIMAMFCLNAESTVVTKQGLIICMLQILSVYECQNVKLKRKNSSNIYKIECLVVSPFTFSNHAFLMNCTMTGNA